jgi:hypothetical protein
MTAAGDLAEAGQRLAIGQPQRHLGALQSLDVRLFIDRLAHRVPENGCRG